MYLEGDGFGPGEGATGAGVVGDPHREAAVLAVRRQKVFARALEVEDPSVEGAVVWVTEYGAHCIVCRAMKTINIPVMT